MLESYPTEEQTSKIWLWAFVPESDLSFCLLGPSLAANLLFSQRVFLNRIHFSCFIIWVTLTFVNKVWT